MGTILKMAKIVLSEDFHIKRRLKRHDYFSQDYPLLYNEKGELYRFVYLEDYICSPYGYTPRIPRRILWDRWNKGLDLQVYSHLAMLYPQKRGENTRQYGLLLESEKIVGRDYDVILERADSVNRLDALFTHSERILDKYANARFMPGGGIYIGTNVGGGEWGESNFNQKRKLISIVSSDKKVCPLHVFRIDIAKEMLKRNIGDVMGTLVGKYIRIADSLTEYMYSVAIENCQSRYYFTEKLLNCFATMTVPVYFGCKDVGKFFNTDGIIIIEKPTVECAMKAISSCSEHDYLSRREAIIDNFNRVQRYMCCEDYLTDNYPELFQI